MRNSHVFRAGVTSVALRREMFARCRVAVEARIADNAPGHSRKRSIPYGCGQRCAADPLRRTFIGKPKDRVALEQIIPNLRAAPNRHSGFGIHSRHENLKNERPEFCQGNDAAIPAAILMHNGRHRGLMVDKELFKRSASGAELVDPLPLKQIIDDL